MDAPSSAAGTFLFILDGHPDAGYIKSVDGGYYKGSLATDQAGPDFTQFKALSTVALEPIALEIGMSLSRPFFQWIEDSWNRKYSRRNGAIVHANFDQEIDYEQSFVNALITETVFPTLDGSDKSGAAYLNVKLQPEDLFLTKSSEVKLGGVVSHKQKSWSPSNFRMELDGVDCSHVSKIDSFKVTQHIKKLHFGTQRYPEIEPTGIEYSNITLYVALSHAKDFMDWYRDYVVIGDLDTKQEKSGRIEFMHPSGKESLMAVSLENVGIMSLNVEKSDANADSIKRVKVELYVEQMRLELGAGLE